MQSNAQCLIDNNKGNISLDKSHLNYRIRRGVELELYPVSDILTVEFRAIVLLHEIEEELKLYDCFKSLVLGDSLV